ncbi:hypothetical protein [Nocardioides sp. R-C-SC26]|uniref:hypothetical protein n=1 Tax=Nocardioides sp. R-C-SC26 TaxID=2870414 RepID=UPI001E61DC15|nr:hypothetical protein [Nocardioides sp. R-C-SC26]
MNTPVARRLAITVSVCAGLAVSSVLGAGSAAADVPEGWPVNDTVEPLHALLVLLGIPLLSALVIALLCYLPSLVRGESIAPGGAATESQWLGGPRKAAGELAAPDGDDSQAGGASGRW